METTAYRIRDLVSKLVDNRGRNTDYFDIEKYPIIDNFMIKNDLHPDLQTATRYLSEEQFMSFLRGYVEKNDLLITLVGNGIGNISLAPHSKCAIVQNTIGMSFDKNICDAIFAFYYFKTIQFAIRNLDRGSSQPSVNREDLLRIKVNLPQIEVQKEISKTVFAYDSLIEANNKRIKILEQMAENLYKEWFVRFRFPGHETAEFENGLPKGWALSSECKPIVPKGWHYGEFGELGKFVRGKNITSVEMIEGEIPVISAGLEPSGFHNEANVHGRSLTISASGANAGYMKYNLDDIWAADCSYYQSEKHLWFAFSTLKFLQPVISNLQCGAAQPHVHPKQINRLTVIIPTDKMIQLYCDVVEPMFCEIKSLKKQNENLTKQRDLLLPRLMSGKLEV